MPRPNFTFPSNIPDLMFFTTKNSYPAKESRLYQADFNSVAIIADCTLRSITRVAAVSTPWSARSDQYKCFGQPDLIRNFESVIYNMSWRNQTLQNAQQQYGMHGPALLKVP